MDIFTTQLARVVPVPIKPASLKVKALVKEAANSKLSQDPDHLENHEYYFTSEAEQYPSSEQDKKKSKQTKTTKGNSSELALDKPDDDTEVNKELPKGKHLDLYA